VTLSRCALGGALLLGCGAPAAKVPIVTPPDGSAPESAAPDAAAETAPEAARAPAPSPVAVQARRPAPGATSVCADTRLELTFSGPVAVGAAGKIQVFADATDAAASAADTIDVGAPYFNDMIGGRRFFTQRPIFVEGAKAVVALHSHALAPGRRYFVTIDAGVFVDAEGRPVAGVMGPEAWSFSTRAAPTVGATIAVAADGAGDVCTVQGAIDAVPSPNTTPVTVTIAPGLYREIVFVSAKSQLTLRGADRAGTVIAYANNDALQQKLGTKYRALVEVENSDDLVIESLTLHNLTPQGGSQAEALRVEPGDRVILRDASFLSLQDTLLLTGRVYATNVYVEGNVDFVWGKGTVYFERSELKTVVRPGYGVQARNPSDRYGYVFVDSKLTAAPGVQGHFLARIDATPMTGYPASHVAFIDCQMGAHVDPRGWLVTPAGVATAGVRFWEYRTTDAAGAPVDVTARDPASRQLGDAEAAMMRDKITVLAGWNPTP
jgi:pectin methylesterase-like acyl-CoA thioesterase